MGNNKMKIVGVSLIMMLVMSLAEADHRFASMEVGSNNDVPMKLTCKAKCGIDCLLSNLAYPICFAICVAKCPKEMSNSLSNDCIRGCGFNKSITINIDARGVVTNVVDSCLQKCETK